MDTFKVGDKVKLKDYSLYSDYTAHEGEVGEITEILEDFDMEYSIKWIKYSIKWNDTSISNADLENLIIVAKEKPKKFWNTFEEYIKKS